MMGEMCEVCVCVCVFVAWNYFPCLLAHMHTSLRSPRVLLSNPSARQCTRALHSLKKGGGEKLLYPANISCLPEHTHMVYLLKNLCRRGEDVLKQRLCASKTCTYVLRRVNKTFTTTGKGGKVYLKLTVIIVVINLLLVNCIFQLGCHLLQRLPLAVSFGDSIDFLLIKTTRYWFLV